jgi:hypothetical protein
VPRSKSSVHASPTNGWRCLSGLRVCVAGGVGAQSEIQLPGRRNALRSPRGSPIREGRCPEQEERLPCHPVNPDATEVCGITCYPDLASIPADVEIEVVDILRRFDAAGRHVDEAIADGAKVLWMQLGRSTRKQPVVVAGPAWTW